MRQFTRILEVIGVLFVLCGEPTLAWTQDQDIDKARAPRPSDFAIVFSFGYGGDKMPKDDAKFEELLKKIKKAGYNVILTTYTPKRLKLCKKHGVKMMLDYLSVTHHHVYKSPNKAEAIAKKLRNNHTVWGYALWHDRIGRTYKGRMRDIRTVRKWDPTHPSFMGTYRVDGMSRLTNGDVLGYYDYHWQRGPQYNYSHLLRYANWCRERQCVFYRWCRDNPGRPGKGNYNRCAYTVHTSITCGCRGGLWFLATDQMNPKTLEWTTVGKDVAKVNLTVIPMANELAKIKIPYAVYSTPITKSSKDRPVDGKDVMPSGLENHRFPKDFFVQPKSGEFAVGFSKAGKNQEIGYFANNNAYLPQKVTLTLKGIKGVDIFSREKKAWQTLKLNNDIVQFEIPPALGMLVRFKK